MAAIRRIVAHGLALALGLASVAAGQTGPADATRESRHLGWATVFAAPPLRTPVSLNLLGAREDIAADTGARRTPVAPQTVLVDARPPPPPTLEERARGAAIFFDVLGGKERRVRPIEDTDRAFTLGSPLVALKFGVARRFWNDWEVAGSLGAAISLVTDEQRVNRSSLFAEAEANKYLAGGSFIGTGLSLWDLARSHLWTPAWLLHFGLPLSRSARYAVFFIGEGRLFFRHIDDVGNNYEIWGGVQVRFRR
jgi:hypothetical protein